MGAKGKPFYRLVVKEKRSKRDGKYLENVGTYNPMINPAEVTLNHERIQYWIGVGAQPTESEEVISTAQGGDWEFRGIRTPSKDLYPSTVEEKS